MQYLLALVHCTLFQEILISHKRKKYSHIREDCLVKKITETLLITEIAGRHIRALKFGVESSLSAVIIFLINEYDSIFHKIYFILK